MMVLPMFMCTGSLVVLGIIFALPLLFSSKKKQRARESQSYRKMLLVRTALISLCVSILGMQLLNAVMISILWQVRAYTPPPCVEEDCGLEYHLLVKDGAFKPPFIMELWLHNIVPLPMLAEDTCFTGNEIVCHLVNVRKSGTPEMHFMNYLIGLGMATIPAAVCTLMVYLFTGKNDKRKPKKRE